MGTLIKQEYFKLFKKKSTFIAPIVFILLMVAQGYIATKYNEIFTPQESFTSAYNGFSWFAFLLIIQASTIISMEFHYGTIKNLLYREYSRTTMIVSKIITLFIISLIYFVITIIASIVIGSLFFNDLNIFESSGNQLSLLNQLLLVSLGTFVGVWLVLSLTLLLSSATNSTGVAIAVGIVFYFASSILAVIQTALLEKIDWLKWNPINMMNIMLQTVEKGFSKSTKLELHELFIGNIAYISIFLILVVFIFKKKNI
ncbi:ABC transporter permease subunit [Staphylococcus aureus]|uniref:ABC transporter permease n=1 Tax=Staphylococcus aureus TaxID=1280 RepID=UPI00139B379D|nr:ABC transporter permease [Staphylococcus aureus]NDR18042.1 ABC transporter permease subunit [Staphylococcus aureus]